MVPVRVIILIFCGLLVAACTGCGGNAPSAKAPPTGTSTNNSATTYWVAPSSCSDSDAGTQAAPFCTINKASTAAVAGDTVMVEDGIYNQTVAIRTNSGTPSQPIVFTAQHKWGAKIEPSDTSGNNNYALSIAGVSYVTIQNFEITATPTSDSAVQIFTGAPNNTIVGNNVHDVGVSSDACISGAGILVADNNEIVSGNMIWNIGPIRSVDFRCNQKHGIYVTAGSGGFIQNNVVFEVWQGLAFHLTGIGLANWTIANNTAFNDGDDIHTDGGGYILDCLGGTCDNNVVSNNIFYDLQNATLFESDDGGTVGTHNVYSNNLVNSSAGNSLLTGSSINTVTSDPEFINYTGNETGNYELSATSPARDAGTSVGAPSADFNGNLIPATDMGYDIGAYQFAEKK